MTTSTLGRAMASSFADLARDPRARGLLETFLRGYQAFEQTGDTPQSAYLAFRQLYCLTDGLFNDRLSTLLQQELPGTRPSEASGVLGALGPAQLADLCARIERDGFVVFDTRLDADRCARLRRLALETPARVDLPEGPRRVRYDRERPLANRYLLEEDVLVRDPVVQELVADPTILALAEAFLGVPPIQDNLALWWLVPFDASLEGLSRSAQLYHFDMDRIRFMKFFVYLTDVTTDTGPHCYVRGSSLRKPAQFRRDGRFSDQELAAAYPADALTELTGPTGTILAVDTRGFHKGKPLVRGERLILQMEYTNSLFGQRYETQNIERAASTPGFLQYLDYVSTRNRTHHRFVVDGRAAGQPEPASEVIVLDELEGWQSPAVGGLFADAIFSDPGLRASLRQLMASGRWSVTSLPDLVTGLASLRGQPQHAAALAELDRYLQSLGQTREPPRLEWSKESAAPAPPTHLDLVDRSTPIGSGGSLVPGLAGYLQGEGFAYVVKETAHDPGRGILRQDHDDRAPIAPASANWGVLASAASFSQLAEHAWGVRQPPRLLERASTEEGQLLFGDPLRRHVWFTSVEAFEAQEQAHREAVRAALLACEVFVLDLAETTAFQLPDGHLLPGRPNTVALLALARPRRLTVEESVAHLQRFLDLARSENPRLKLVTLVSPAPCQLVGLGEETDAAAENRAAKADLRAALLELGRRNAGVHYLPAYEALAAEETPFEPDGQTLTAAGAQRLGELFRASFVR